MKPLPRWLTFGLLPLVVLCDAFAWYAMSAGLTPRLIELGLAFDDVKSLRTLMQWVILGGTLVGGVAAVGVGPWVLLVLGAMLTALGIGVMGLVPGAVYPAVVLAAVGHGLMRPAIYGAAARAFALPYEHVRNALFVLLWGSMNLGALLGPMLATSGQGSLGFAPVAFVATAVMLFAVPVAGAVGLVHLLSMRGEKPEPGFAVQGRHLIAVAGVILVLAVPWGMYGLSYEALWHAVEGLPHEEQQAWMSFNPVAVGIFAALLCAAFVLMHLLRAKVPTLLFAGIGLVLVAAGAALLAVAGSDGTIALVLGLILLSLGEVLAGPLLLSRIAGDMPPRLVCAAPALWFVATGLVNHAAFALAGADSDVGRVLVWVMVALVVLAGLASAGAAFPLRAVFPAGGEESES